MKNLASRIVDATLLCKNAKKIETLKIGEGPWMNEALFFIKPEVFALGERTHAEKVVQYAIDSFARFDAKVEGIYAVSGSFLERHNIMSRHYGYINTVSNSASKILDDDLRARIEKEFGLQRGKYEVLGGHEYIRKYPGETPISLDAVWFEKKSVKLRSGFYIRHVKKDGADVVLINGFHPNQLAHFTDPSHRLVLMLIHSNNSWSNLKNEMVGNSFPEKAVPQSMRGEFYLHAKDYGFGSVSIANNCVHLSAGPFEGMAEIANFFGKITKLDIQREQPILYKRMVAAGIGADAALGSISNPKIEYNGKATDLFTATEDTDTDKAISIFRETVLDKL